MVEMITCDPEILAGKPVIRGTRISVALILKLFSSGWTLERILDNYPHLTREGVLAALDYASSILERERTVPLSGAS